MGILDFFPGTPRKVQEKCLLEVEKAWESHDVFVVVAPTACGKTLMAKTIADWSGRASIVVPNNVLLDQYIDMCPGINNLKKRGSYQCKTHHRSCEETHRLLKRCCSRTPCSYRLARLAAKSAAVGVYNYWTYMVHRLYRPTLIVDEAHLLLPTLQDIATKRIWQFQYKWPLGIKTLGDLVSWVESHPNPDKKLTKLKKELLATEETTLIQKTLERWRGGEERPVLKLTPLDTKRESPIFWPPKKVHKVVLMSATISKVDVESMGLANKRVCYIECDSPIPTENRPIIYKPIADMSYKNQNRSIPLMADYLKILLDEHEDKGILHCSYSVATKLWEYLKDEKRLIWHDRENKLNTLEEWLQSEPEDGYVLVSSGMWEGLDLKEDLARWQAILKVPYPSLADPAIKAKLNKDEDWYLWTTLRTIVQGCGRISRDSTDYGVTFCLDSQFGRVYNKGYDLLPKWFREAVLIED
jgi:Rad3-related DNA helicase